MNIWVGIGTYILCMIVNVFLWLLFARLIGNSPEEVYDSEEAFPVMFVMAIFTCVTLPIVIFIFIFMILRKYMIALIEFIVAMYEEKNNE